MPSIDLNADLGESFGPWRMGNDEAILEVISSANIACGFHASDPLEMRKVVRLAKKNDVGIGAHPGFADLQGVGRRRILGIPDDELQAMIVYQIGALQAIAAMENARVRHIKIHGALNNMASEDYSIAEPCLAAIKMLPDDLITLVLPRTDLERAGHELQMPVAAEVFADRAYNDDGTLVHRGQPGAMIHDASEASDNILAMIENQEITSINGKKIPVKPETVCVHGDGPEAVQTATALRRKLEDAGITIRRFGAG
ncbi:MAG: LamB/YcsF family protein [Hyphomicrobiaceae bacterium]